MPVDHEFGKKKAAPPKKAAEPKTEQKVEVKAETASNAVAVVADGASPAKTEKKAVVVEKNEESEEAPSTDGDHVELDNALNDSRAGITLSVFHERSMRKKKFQEEYYSTPSGKTLPVQSRLQMVEAASRLESKLAHDSDALEKLMKDKKQRYYSQAKIKEPFGNPASVDSSYGLKIVAQMGNISGLHLDESAAKLFRQNNSVLLSSQTQYLKANEIVQTAIEEQKELEAKAKAKELAKKKKKDDKNKKKGAEEEEP